MLISASILSANFASLQEEVDSVASADWIQADVMDGHFVPNLSFGAPVLRSLHIPLPLDIHLMVSNPLDRIDEFLSLGNIKNITCHAEVTSTEQRTIISDRLHTAGVMAGIAINPATPLSAIEDDLHLFDLLLIMSVHPGFSGQKFIPDVLSKVQEARAKYPHLMIQMDGGIDVQTAHLVAESGATNLVAASAIFQADNRAQAIADLRKSCIITA